MKKKLVNFLFVFICFTSLHAQQFSKEEKMSYFKYAQEMYNEAKYELTIENCSIIITKPGAADAETYLLRAKAYRYLADYENAVKDYGAAISAFQNRNVRVDPTLYFDKGMGLMCQKKFDQALKEFNNARRIFRDAGNAGKENYIFLEEIGRVNHFMEENKSAIEMLKSAIQEGSVFAYIDLVSSLLQNNSIAELKYYSDSLLTGDVYPFMADSMYYYYISALNDISQNNITDATIEKINNSLNNYRTSNSSCFQGFSSDLLYARAYIYSSLGNDMAAYGDYRSIVKNNTWLKSVKKKTDDLKIKLGIDVTPPKITLRYPEVDNDNYVQIKAAKGKQQIYGQVTDSSGVDNITISTNGRVVGTITKFEKDGSFGFDVTLNAGNNTLVINATDKNENSIPQTFKIDFVEKDYNARNKNDIAEDDLPDIDSSINYFAVLIAEKDYDDEGFKDLLSPVDDAMEIKDILVNQYNFKDENVRLLANAGRQAILDSLNQICKMMTNSDNLLVFYAGHGTENKLNNQIIGGYIIPADAVKGKKETYISNDEFTSPINNTQAKHVLFIADACFAGLMRSALDDVPQGLKTSFNHKSRRILTSGNREEVPDQGQFIVNLKNFLRTEGGKYFLAQDIYNYIILNNQTNNSPTYERLEDTGDEFIGQFLFMRR